MSYVFESLDEFLFENFGNLQKYNLPKSLLSKIFGGVSYQTTVGKDSPVIPVENLTDYKKFTAELKERFLFGIISVEGLPKFLFNRISDRKFKIFNIEKEREEIIKDAERKKERARREAEWEAKRKNESLSEGRRGSSGYYDPALLGEYSTPELFDFIKKISGEVIVELVGEDKVREETRTKRNELKRKVDPLKPEGEKGYYYSGSKSQRLRYDKYSASKRTEIDQKVEDVKESIKNQINNNLDKAIDNIVSELRKGYSWYADPKKLADEILKGVNFSQLQKLASAYDAVEPGKSMPEDIIKATQAMKKFR